MGTFLGTLLISYVFFMPFFKRRLVLKDSRLRIYHVVLGPYRLTKDPWLPWPGKGGEEVVTDYKDLLWRFLQRKYLHHISNHQSPVSVME